MSKELPVLDGNNLYLKEISINYIDLVMEWRNRPEIMDCFFHRSKLTPEGQRKWFEKYSGDETDHMFMLMAKDECPIGTMALYNIDMKNRKAEYGRALVASQSFRGKGYAKEALDLLLGYAFNTLELNRIYLEVFSDNTSAVKLYERCGFRREGLLRENFFDGASYRDVMIMGILNKEYKKN